MTTEGSNRMNNDIQNQDDSSPLISLIDSINLTNLNEYYDHKTDILFKKRIDKLNVKFYLETEKCMDARTHEEIEKSHDKLFLILFKQISLYIEEIERLNKYIISLPEPSEKTDDTELKRKDSEMYQNTITSLKNQNKVLEKKLTEKVINEEKKNIEIQSLKRQINFYKEKIKVDISTNSSNNKKMNSPIKRDISHSPVNGHQYKKSYIQKAVALGNSDQKKNYINLSKSIEHKENRSVSNKSVSISKNKDAKTLISYFENEYEELCRFEELLLKQKNEIEQKNKEENVEDSQGDLFSKMIKKNTMNNKKGNTNNVIFNGNNNSKKNRDKSTNRKKNIPVLTSIQIDL